jgi:hypothetical protein
MFTAILGAPEINFNYYDTLLELPGAYHKAFATGS